jgi:hypothetical protein
MVPLLTMEMVNAQFIGTFSKQYSNLTGILLLPIDT